MKGTQLLAQLDKTQPKMSSEIPGLPAEGTSMVRLLRVVGYCLGNYFDPMFRRLGVSEQKFHVLCLLHVFPSGDLTPSDVAMLMGTSRGNATHVINDLHESGYLLKKSLPGDARSYQLWLTDAGRTRVSSLVPNIAAPINNAFHGLAEHEMLDLVRLLKKLVASFDEALSLPITSIGAEQE